MKRAIVLPKLPTVSGMDTGTTKLKSMTIKAIAGLVGRKSAVNCKVHVDSTSLVIRLEMILPLYSINQLVKKT